MKQGSGSGTGVRVIGGERRGKRLLTVRGLITRPTANRVREAIFNIIGSRVADATVLDLYAGTGIFGIEALSRSARYALFIDSEPAAVDIIQRNLLACRFDSRADILQRDLPTGLGSLANHRGRFSLVFMDPPYRLGLIEKTLSRLHASGIPAPGAHIVAEYSVEESISDLSPPFTEIDRRKYGKTLVSFINYII